jgi:Type VI secretion system, TssO
MAPSNQAERRKAFSNFLLFFIITVGVIITTVLFSFQVPFKENAKLRNEKELRDNEKAALMSFEHNLQEALNMLDTIDRASNPYVVQGLIENRLSAMSGIAIRDSAWSRSIMEKVVRSLYSLKAARENLSSLNKNTAKSENKDEEIQRLNDKIDQCNKEKFDLLKDLAKQSKKG